jgi:DNA polymerase III subunit delta
LKISGDNLAASVARQLGCIYLISGDEPLLVDEAADTVRAAARAQGFTERALHVIERGFDWSALRAESRSLSLFAERRIIELRMPNAAPGDAGSAVLQELAQERPADNLVLVITGKLDGRTQSSRWVSAIEQHGTFVQIWPVDLPRLPAWIRQRLHKHGLRVDAEGATLLAQRVEGNLLAAHQEVEKLALSLPPGDLDVEAIAEAVADSARFDVLQLGEAAMRGDAARALRILDGLRGEGTELPLVMWAVNRDLQWLARARHLMSQGQSADGAMNAIYVWRARQAAMKPALARLSHRDVCELLVDAERTDRSIKGVLRTDPWVELAALIARLAGVKLARVA